jgi:2-oxoglutarate dehydrogenase complex dehydrogenase (E1) component-like enzyme
VNFVDPNVFETANAGFAQAMYEEFLRDPATVGPEWRRLFESGVVGEKPGAGGEADGRNGGRADGRTGRRADGRTGGRADGR